MWPLCTHKWTILAKTVVPPTTLSRNQLTGLPAMDAIELLKGTTSFLLSCARCPETRQYKLEGTEVDPTTHDLERMLGR